MWFNRLSNNNKIYLITGVLSFIIAIVALIVGLTCNNTTPGTEIGGSIFFVFIAIFVVMTVLFIIEYRKPIKTRKGTNADISIPLLKKDCFLLNSKTKQWQVFFNGNFTKEYNLTDMTEFSFNRNDEVLYKSSMSAIPMVAGGMLFGGLGALAGALIKNNNQEIKVKEKYTLYIGTNDISNAGMVLECNKESMYQLAKTFELLEKEIKQK